MIIKATLDHCTALAELAVQLWPGHDFDELEKDFAAKIADGKDACFIKYEEDSPAGFAHCALRSDYVEGTCTSPVGYLEGVFVCEASRGKGVGKQLVSACEGWAKEMGCSEFASDCEAVNSASLAFHLAAGFAEANRIICFRKDI